MCNFKPDTLPRFAGVFPALVIAGLVLVFELSVINPLRAAEIIHDYDVTVEIAPSGELTVTEKIRVSAEGDQIKRGIYRDFPMMFEDGSGKERRVGFSLLSVTRDGKAEPHFTRSGPRMVRIYAGDEDVYLDFGVYEYVFRYRSDRQIRFFDDHDELLWNATGNGWVFPIERASALVILPPGVQSSGEVAYTGSFGSTQSNARAEVRKDGAEIYFLTTAPLSAYEGLTVGVRMPKGSIAGPDGATRAAWFWRDFAGHIIALMTLAIAFWYYLWAWLRVGRDPPKGIIVPQWHPPANVSPALANYIVNKGFSGNSWRAISSAILNLAVKGQLSLSGLDSDLTVNPKRSKAGASLPVGERVIYADLSRYGSPLIVNKANGTEVQKLQRKFVGAMEREHRQVFYLSNYGYVFAGLAITIIGVAILLFFGNLDPAMLGVLIPTVIIGIIVTVLIVSSVKSFGAGRSLWRKILTILVFIPAAIALLSVAVTIYASFMDALTQPVLIAAVAGILMINLTFFFLIGAPTPLGREKMDAIAGLKQYLVLAEQDRMNLAGAPQMSPKHFETLLPYAVALKVEKPWSSSFQKWLLTAAGAAAAAHYVPRWYRGRDFSTDRIGDNFGNMANDMASSFTASMPAPKSSSSGFSGGGGGFSGGGGGGGGGGGW